MESTPAFQHPVAARPGRLSRAVRAALGPRRTRWTTAALIAPLALLHGPAQALEVELTELDGTNGFIVQGIAAYDALGGSVSDAGDLNGDGIADFIVGAPDADPGGRDGAGQAYVIFGRSDGFRTRERAAQLDGLTGFAINGAAPGDRAGRSVSAAGDVNGDGFGDLAIGAGAKAYLVFGAAGGFAPALELSALDGTNGVALQGGGVAVSAVGDVNGDGLSDVLVGADRNAPGGLAEAGQAFVVFGSNAPFPASLDLTALDGTNGFALNGAAAGDRAGFAVAGPGDTNGDGVDDILVGAPNVGDQNTGAAYLVLGRTTGFGAAVELGTLDATTGTVIPGIENAAQTGSWVGRAGDLNGDGFADLSVGSWNVPRTQVLFGSASGLGALFDLNTLDGTNGMVLEGTGGPARAAGDVNGDGVGDLLAGAPEASPGGRSRAGQTYVMYGRAGGGFPAAIALAALGDSEGFILNGRKPTDASGTAVAAAGDVDGDGVDDLLIGAPGANNVDLKDVGEGYVWFGRVGGPGAPTAVDAIGTFTPATRTFRLDADGDGTWNPATDSTVGPFGGSADVAVTGDWNGDGRNEVGAYRTTNGRFYLDMNGNGVWDDGVDRVTGSFGGVSDRPVIGDWNGDGTDQIGVYRPSAGRFYLDTDGDGLWNAATDTAAAFGGASDLPVAGDWNGDGRDEIGIFRPAVGKFFLDANGNGVWDSGIDLASGVFGGPNDLPVAGDWNGDGTDQIGVYRTTNGRFYLDADGSLAWSSGTDIVSGPFGVAGDLPVTGRW